MWSFQTNHEPQFKTAQVPNPKIENLFATLPKGAKLDLMVPVTEESSKQYMVIHTHKGLFRYNCLHFVISSTLEILQRAMESVLQGVAIYIYIYTDHIFLT